LGKVSARLTLVDEQSISQKNIVIRRGEIGGFPLLKKDSAGAVPAPSLVEPLHPHHGNSQEHRGYPASDSSGDKAASKGGHVVFADPIHSAMNFVPNEAPKFVDRMQESEECYLGVVVHDIVDFALLQMQPREDVEAVRVLIGYKSSQR
jgi:hypothetical protein